MIRAYWRIRAWWHAQLYHPTEVTPLVDDGLVSEGFVVECSCGGSGQVRRNGDGTASVTDATCPVWRYRLRCRPMLDFPTARVLKGAVRS